VNTTFFDTPGHGTSSLEKTGAQIGGVHGVYRCDHADADADADADANANARHGPPPFQSAP